MTNDLTLPEVLGYLLLGLPIWLALWWAFFYPLEKRLLASENDFPRYLGIGRRRNK